MPAECPICLQDYGPECSAAALPCGKIASRHFYWIAIAHPSQGHVYCFDCITLHGEKPGRPVCPGCRNPFDTYRVVKLYIDFDASEPPIEPEDNLEQAVAPPLTPAQCAQADQLACDMAKLGIEADSEALGGVLSDVKRWAGGVEEIQDLETQASLLCRCLVIIQWYADDTYRLL